MMIEIAERPLVIAAFGTSLTARGVWLERLPAELERISRRPVRAVNFARVGATSRWGASIIEDVAREQPDIAIIEFATNDAALHYGVSLSESEANLTTIIRGLHTANREIRLYLMTMNPTTGLRGLLRPRLARFYDLYPRISTRERIGLIDNRPDWRALPPAMIVRAIPDGCHPAPEFSVSITLANVLRVLGREHGGARARSIRD